MLPAEGFTLFWEFSHAPAFAVIFPASLKNCTPSQHNHFKIVPKLFYSLNKMHLIISTLVTIIANNATNNIFDIIFIDLKIFINH